jgi:hypothetical protein
LIFFFGTRRRPAPAFMMASHRNHARELSLELLRMRAAGAGL